MTRIRGVAIVVPARDEEALVEACLRSIEVAVDVARQADPELSVGVVLVADCCTDRTAELAAGFAGVQVLETRVRRVGASRALGVERALADLAETVSSVSPAALWIANADADGTVPPNWVTVQLDAAEAGADVVVGTVRPDPEALTDEQNERWLATHRRGEPNGHVHGANLGIRASSYRAAGGFEALDEHEDNQIVARLRDLGAALVASDDAEVITSARLVGRTPGGYAGYLAGSL